MLRQLLAERRARRRTRHGGTRPRAAPAVPHPPQMQTLQAIAGCLDVQSGSGRDSSPTEVAARSECDVHVGNASSAAVKGGSSRFSVSQGAAAPTSSRAGGSEADPASEVADELPGEPLDPQATPADLTANAADAAANAAVADALRSPPHTAAAAAAEVSAAGSAAGAGPGTADSSAKSAAEELETVSSSVITTFPDLPSSRAASTALSPTREGGYLNIPIIPLRHRRRRRRTCGVSRHQCDSQLSFGACAFPARNAPLIAFWCRQLPHHCAHITGCAAALQARRRMATGGSQLWRLQSRAGAPRAPSKSTPPSCTGACLSPTCPAAASPRRQLATIAATRACAS